MLPLAHAAEDVAIHASSRQLTLTTLLLIGLLLVLMAGFVFWSWRRRQGLAQERRIAESALRAAEGRLAHLSSQLPIALFQFAAGGFSYVSPGIARLLPCTAAEAEADPARVLEAILDKDRAGMEWLNGTLPAAADIDWIGRIATAEGAPRWLQVRASSEIGTDGTRVISGVMIDVTPLKTTQQELERSRAELRQLAVHREARVEQEKQRLAREFHDELGQVLTTARMQLQLMARNPGSGRVEDVEALIGEAYRSVKAIAADLRPPALNLGLTAAVEWLAGRLLAPAGIIVRIDFAPTADVLPEAQAIVLFRIVQEALSNIVRHARAQRVQLIFNADMLNARLVIRDDGIGFDPGRVDRSAHFGLLGVSERASAIGGLLQIDSQAGTGTTLTIEFTLCSDS
jgi:signal transduction histidine kinase